MLPATTLSSLCTLPLLLPPPDAPLILLSVPCKHTVIEDDANEDELEHNDEDETSFVPDGPQVHVVHHLPRRAREPTSLLDLDWSEERRTTYTAA